MTLSDPMYEEHDPRTYFFLGYERSAPLSDDRIDVADTWSVNADRDTAVDRFFQQLREEVARRARPGSPWSPGFCDHQLPDGADFKAELATALSATHVFVALYSPGYVSKSWARRELRAYRTRLADAGVPDPDRYILPVLWTPLPRLKYPPDVLTTARTALRLGEDIPGYAENGVRALQMLRPFAESYRQVLERLAARIVDVADSSPLERSSVPDLDDVEDDLLDPSFVVGALTGHNPPLGQGRPAPGGLPGEGGHGGYRAGAQPIIDRAVPQWRPFRASPSLSAARYAADLAERLGLATRVSAVAELPALTELTPGIVIVDPWVLMHHDGQAVLVEVFRTLPPWVLPLVVTDPDDKRYDGIGKPLADRTVDLLRSATSEPVTRADGLAEFVSTLPSAITRARRTYLRRGPVHPPPPARRSRGPSGTAHGTGTSEPGGTTDE